MSRVALALALPLVLAGARAATAGPWCSEDVGGWSPRIAVVPPRAHVVYASGLLYYAKQRHPAGKEGEALADMAMTATIGGKPVELVVAKSETPSVSFIAFDIASDAAGPLAIAFTDRDKSVALAGKFVVDPAWAPPAAVALVAAKPFTRAVIMMRAADDHLVHGAELELDADATDYTGRWRRDAKDGWHALHLPALAARTAGHTLVDLGETHCAAATVPPALLAAGIELELTAHLANGKTLPVGKIPRPLVVPLAKDPTDGAPPLPPIK